MASKIKGYNKDPICENDPEQRFFINDDFLRGKDTTKTEDDPLVTSKDSSTFYLLVADELNRRLWVFLLVDKKNQLT